MSAVLGEAENLFDVVFFLTLILYLVPKKSYQKYPCNLQ